MILEGSKDNYSLQEATIGAKIWCKDVAQGVAVVPRSDHASPFRLLALKSVRFVGETQVYAGEDGKAFSIESLVSRAPNLQTFVPPIRIENGGAFGEVSDMFRNVLGDGEAEARENEQGMAASMQHERLANNTSLFYSQFKHLKHLDFKMAQPLAHLRIPATLTTLSFTQHQTAPLDTLPPLALLLPFPESSLKHLSITSPSLSSL